MPDMGFRDNVMGPQPIAPRKQVPESAHKAIDEILDLLIAGKTDELIARAVDSAKDETRALASAVKPAAYNARSVLAIARTNEHYWVKAKLAGPDLKPFTLQLRLGPSADSWAIWEAANLSDSRSAWTR